MELRSKLHSKPWLTVLICAVVLAGGIVYSMKGGSGAGKSRYSNPGNYYTADEGQTYVADTWDKMPPFEREGRTWVRVYLFQGETGKPPTVGYLEKYRPDALQELQSIEENNIRIARMSEWGDRALQVKRPGDANWVDKESAQGLAIVKIDGNPVKPPEIPQ